MGKLGKKTRKKDYQGDQIKQIYYLHLKNQGYYGISFINETKRVLARVKSSKISTTAVVSILTGLFWCQNVALGLAKIYLQLSAGDADRRLQHADFFCKNLLRRIQLDQLGLWKNEDEGNILRTFCTQKM